MILHDEGKLSLRDSVHKFIPQFKQPEVLVSLDPLGYDACLRFGSVGNLQAAQLSKTEAGVNGTVSFRVRSYVNRGN